MDEWQLVRLAQAGDEAAFSCLVERHQGLVRAIVTQYVGSSDAHDAAQEVWLAVHRKLWQLEEEGKFVPWLRQVCYYQCVNFRKARTRRTSREAYLDGQLWLHLAECVADSDYKVEEMVERSEFRCTIAQQLDELPSDYGSILRLRYFEDLSYEEIASLTALPLSTVKWRLHHAKQLLKSRLAALVGQGRGFK